jgi:hypothetical protein
LLDIEREQTLCLHQANFVAMHFCNVTFLSDPIILAARSQGGYTLVTLPNIVTPYRDSVDDTRARVTYQKLVTR